MRRVSTHQCCDSLTYGGGGQGIPQLDGGPALPPLKKDQPAQFLKMSDAMRLCLTSTFLGLCQDVLLLVAFALCDEQNLFCRTQQPNWTDVLNGVVHNTSTGASSLACTLEFVYWFQAVPKISL